MSSVRRTAASLAALCASFLLGACSENEGSKPDRTEKDGSAVMTDEDAGEPDSGQSELPPGCEVLVNDDDCDKTRRPIVFVHGTVANGDSFAHPALILASNGYCPDRIRGIEYHSLVAADAGAGDAGAGDGGTGDAGLNDAGRPAAFVLDRAEAYRRAAADIDRVIEELRRDTGFDKVDLAGHSQGSGHGAAYAGMNPDKVAHYIHLAGAALPTDPGGVPTLCLSSIGDRPVMCGTTKNVTFQDNELDHSAVSSATEAAIEMYKFLNDGAEPRYTEVQCGSPILLEGRAQTFAENAILVGSKVEIYALGDSPRERGAPEASYTIGTDGKFGPFEAKRDVSYEFRLVPPSADTTRRVAHAYYPPFKRSDRLLRFNFETKDPVASATSLLVNRGPGFSVVIPRSRQKAFLYDRDSLKVNGHEVITKATSWNAMTNRSNVIVAYYLFDKSLTHPAYGDGDKLTSGEPIISGAFVSSADMYFSAEQPAWITLEFNGQTMKVPNWPSVPEGASVVFLN
jgi:pimeloyl-ACP methyl ester carboxylesterase